MMNLVFGLTGGIGSGKTAVTDRLSKFGVAIIDADVVSRNLTASPGPIWETLRQWWGTDLFADDGSLLRAKLREKVFADDSARQALEALLHPLIRREIESELQGLVDTPLVVLSAPLLLETGQLLPLVKRLIVVDCSETVQIERTMARSGLSREEVIKIMGKQHSRSDRLKRADYVLENDGSLEALSTSVARLHDWMSSEQRHDRARISEQGVNALSGYVAQ